MSNAQYGVKIKGECKSAFFDALFSVSKLEHANNINLVEKY